MVMTPASFLSLGPEGFHRIAYGTWRSGESRHAVLCVHGLSRNSRDFDPLAAALEDDCRVICMDVVGRGDIEAGGAPPVAEPRQDLLAMTQRRFLLS